MENNKQPLNEEKVFKKGMKLTVVGEIVDIYYPEKITGFKLNCTYGIWSTKTFKETLNIK